MAYRLIALSGPLKGELFDLRGGQVGFGRSRSNPICINSERVSRRHCAIELDGDERILEDLGSKNGTFVNGIPITRKPLEHGDQIRVGESVFLFSSRDEAPGLPAIEVELDDQDVKTASSLELTLDEAARVQDGNVDEAASRKDADTGRALEALVKFSLRVDAAAGPDIVGRELLSAALDAVSGDSGAVLLLGKDGEEIAASLGHDRSAGSDSTVRVSRTVVRRVLESGAAILMNDVQKNAWLRSLDSVSLADAQSILAIPLLARGSRIGVLYLSTARPESPFDRSHLQLATALSAIAAPALNGAQRLEHLQRENERLLTEIRTDHQMVGESQAMRSVQEFIAKVAPTDSTVLICGESGTGKELAARAIHHASRRTDKPFIAVNCAALVETLLESELFGHEKGAFTGASALKRGKIEIADEGTLFLDEIAEMTPSIQAKLLRALQEQKFERVGGTRPIKVDVRIIAATNKDLKSAVKAGTIREDLYYRLNVVVVTLAPLRERREDIPLLASYFAAKFGAKCGREALEISDAARSHLMRYHWPGNVRELENAIEHAVVLGSGDRILPADLPKDVTDRGGDHHQEAVQYHDAIKELKKRLIVRAVRQAKGSYVDAAGILGVHPNYLHRLVRALDLKEDLGR